MVQNAAPKSQSQRNRPSYIVLVQGPGCEAEDVPMSTTAIACRMKQHEGCYLRCTSKDCPLRPGSERPAAEQPASHAEEFEPEDVAAEFLASNIDAETVDVPEQDADADADGADVPMPDDGEPSKKRDFIIDLWPFAHPEDFY